MVKITFSSYSEKLNNSIIHTPTYVPPTNNPTPSTNSNSIFSDMSVPVYGDDGLSTTKQLSDIFNEPTTPITTSLENGQLTDTFYQFNTVPNVDTVHIQTTPYVPNTPNIINTPSLPNTENLFTPPLSPISPSTTYFDFNSLQIQQASFSPIKDFMSFIGEIKDKGFFVALFDKPLSQILIDTFYEVIKALGIFITGNGDIFFLMPAIAFITATFVVGRNRFTKWIIPLVFAYAVSRIAFKMILAIS